VTVEAPRFSVVNWCLNPRWALVRSDSTNEEKGRALWRAPSVLIELRQLQVDLAAQKARQSNDP
jgi:hypothetical protein